MWPSIGSVVSRVRRRSFAMIIPFRRRLGRRHLPGSAKYGVPPLAGIHPNGATSPPKAGLPRNFRSPLLSIGQRSCWVTGQPHAPAPFKRLTGPLESDASCMRSPARSPGQAAEQAQFHVPCGCRAIPLWCRKFALISWPHGRRGAPTIGNHIPLVTPTAAAY